MNNFSVLNTSASWRTIFEDSLVGWSTGYQYARAKTKEDEIKQGKNYYLTVFPQWAQLGGLANLTDKIATTYITNPVLRITTRVLSNVVPISSAVALLVAASVKHGHYEAGAKLWNKYVPLKVPEHVGPRTAAVMGFFSEHTGDIVRVAMVVGAVAITAMGSPFFGVPILVALGYEAIDNRGFVPRRISLFMEKYMPTVSLFGIVFGGAFVERAIAVLILPSYLFPSVNKQLHQLVDHIAHKAFGKTGPTLKEMDAPIADKKNLSYDEITKVLDGTATYEISPAHCSKWTIDLSKLPTDKNFTEFLTHFDSIDWTQKYALVKNKLKDDDRFIDFLMQEFPGTEKEELKKNTLTYIDKLVEKEANKQRDMLHAIANAKKITTKQIKYVKELVNQKFITKKDGDSILKIANKKTISEKDHAAIKEIAQNHAITSERYIAHWLREQMVYLVSALKGDFGVRIKGQQQDLDDGITNCSKILPYLDSLDPIKDKIAREDCLLKLAVEGGKYCGRGIKRASNELVSTVLRATSSKTAKKANKDTSDPLADYEFDIRQSLQEQRFRIIETTYKKNAEQLHIPAAISEDTHAFDIYRAALTLGFAPLTDHERNGIGVGDLITWERWSAIRENMYKSYRDNLDEAINQTGEAAKFGQYLEGVIKTNPRLTPEEKTKLLNRYSLVEGNELSDQPLSWHEEFTLLSNPIIKGRYEELLKKYKKTQLSYEQQEKQVKTLEAGFEKLKSSISALESDSEVSDEQRQAYRSRIATYPAKIEQARKQLENSGSSDEVDAHIKVKILREIQHEQSFHRLMFVMLNILREKK